MQPDAGVADRLDVGEVEEEDVVLVEGKRDEEGGEIGEEHDLDNVLGVRGEDGVRHSGVPGLRGGVAGQWQRRGRVAGWRAAVAG